MVVHDLPIRPQRRVPDEIYGRAYRRDPEEWLRRKRKKLARRARLGVAARRQAREGAQALKRRGWVGEERI